MQIEFLSPAGSALIRPRRFGDARGWFMETYNARSFAAAGLPTEYVQDNASLSCETGTVRGLHYQLPPFEQAKLVQVIRGRILDVIVDIRRNSPSFGQHLTVEMSADNSEMLFVPTGFAHGFWTLEPDTEVRYKVTAPYAPAQERGIRWDDPSLGIAWPKTTPSVLSDKDARYGGLAAAELP